MASDAAPRPHAWRVVALLWFAVLSEFLSRLLPTTMHGSLVAAIPMTESQFGLLTSSLFWTYAMTSPFAGFVGDRFSRSRVIVTSMALWSTLTWLISYARTFEQLLILRSLMGFSQALYMPAALALISDYHRSGTRSLATGIHQAGTAIGIGISGLGGWLATLRGWHFAFSLVGLVGIAYSAFLAVTLRDAPRENREGIATAGAGPKVRPREALVSLFSRGSFGLAFISSALIGEAGWTIFAWSPVFLQEHFHLTQGAAGLSATAYMQAAAVPGMLIGGIWADRWSRTNGRARMFVPAIGLLIAAPSVLLTANAPLLVLAVLGLVLYRLFTAFFGANLMPIVCEVVDTRYRATAYGVVDFVGAIAAGGGVYFSGVLRDRNIDLRIAFDLVAIILVLNSATLFFIKPKTRSE